MPSFTHNSFVCGADTIEMSSIVFERGCSRGLFPVSLHDESVAPLATVQDSVCEVRRLKILWKKLQRGGKWGHHPITIWIWSSPQCRLLQQPARSLGKIQDCLAADVMEAAVLGRKKKPKKKTLLFSISEKHTCMLEISDFSFSFLNVYFCDWNIFPFLVFSRPTSSGKLCLCLTWHHFKLLLQDSAS